MRYPVLQSLADSALYSLADTAQFQVGRSRDADLVVMDVSCSRQQFRIIRENNTYFLEPQSESNPTVCNGEIVSARMPLHHLADIQVGPNTFRFLEHEPDEVSFADESDALDRQTIVKVPVQSVLMRIDRTMVGSRDECQMAGFEVLKNSFPVVGSMLIGRHAHRVQIHLPHLHVSGLHAQITAASNQGTITDLNSANGTFVNGRRISQAMRIQPNDRIDIGPYTLFFTGHSLEFQSRANNLELVAVSLRREVPVPATRVTKRLLDDVSLVVHPKEFVAIIGPSGSGKSTLLSCLSARAPLNGGQVLLNGSDFHADFELLKNDVVVVPQRDMLFDTLTPDQMLRFTARLRLPPETTSAEVEVRITEVLTTVCLLEHRRTMIRHLSGGQRKRASLANELIAGASLLFLDEVTSGLDEQADEEFMKLFRQLADLGKTVVCITHTLAHIPGNCHRVVILATGGQLAFVGSPAEAIEYFSINQLGKVFDTLSRRPDMDWGQRFRDHPLFRNCQPSTGPIQAQRRLSPRKPHISLQENWTQFWRQTGILLIRHLAVLLGDRQHLGLMASQAAIVAWLFVLVFGNIPGIENVFERKQATHILWFLAGLSALWFGCNNAARELVKERPVFQQERDVNLRTDSYLASKLILLFGCTYIQSTFLHLTILLLCRPSGQIIGSWFVLTLLALTGVVSGMAISAMARTEQAAIALVPVFLIPQIILSDVIAKLRGFSLLLAQACVPAYWGIKALHALVPEDDTPSAMHKVSFVAGTSMVLFDLATVACLTFILTVGSDSLFGKTSRRQLPKNLRETIAPPIVN